MRRAVPAAIVGVAGLVALVALLWPTHIDGTIAFAIDSFPAPRSVISAVHVIVGAAGNIVLFVPIGIALRHLFRRPWLAIIASAVFSSAVEAVQGLFLERTTDAWDVVWNTVGAAVGVIVTGLYLRRRPDSSRPISEVRCIGGLEPGDRVDQ